MGIARQRMQVKPDTTESAGQPYAYISFTSLMNDIILCMHYTVLINYSFPKLFIYCVFYLLFVSYFTYILTLIFDNYELKDRKMEQNWFSEIL